MGKYEQDARLLLEYVGGKENIAAVSHCVSRMRFVLNDPAKADVVKIESLKSAKGTFTQAGQFQVIIGNTVNDFYNDFIAVSGIDGVSKDAVKSAAKQNQNALQRIMSVLAEIFAPLIPAIITGGLILGFRNCIDSMLATAIHCMRGTPYIYQGEELGMTNPHFTEIDQYRDVESLNYYKILREQGKSEAETLNILAKRSRDDGRTPMQWDSSPNAGFTSGTPWIGVADNYKSINAAAQTSDADSIYSFYKAMVRLRKEHRVISEGKIEFLYPDNTDLLAYRRYGSADKEELLVLCNLTEQEIHAELPDAWATAEKLIGNYVDNPSETLRPYECVVLHTTKE